MTHFSWFFFWLGCFTYKLGYWQASSGTISDEKWPCCCSHRRWDKWCSCVSWGIKFLNCASIESFSLPNVFLIVFRLLEWICNRIFQWESCNRSGKREFINMMISFVLGYQTYRSLRVKWRRYLYLVELSLRYGMSIPQMECPTPLNVLLNLHKWVRNTGFMFCGFSPMYTDILWPGRSCCFVDI